MHRVLVEPGEPLAVTRGGRTTFSREVATHPDLTRIAAHEQVHRAQAASASPCGDRDELERDAHVGTKRLLRGEPHTPRFSAPPEMELGYQPTDLFPSLGTQAETESADLTREGLDDPSNRIGLQSGRTQNQTEGTAHAHYEVRVGASGRRGAIQSDTVVDLDYQPDRRMTVVGQPVIQINPEMGLGPTHDVPAMPIQLEYSRTIVYRDDHGRSANVVIDGIVFFSEATWAAHMGAGFVPSYETLLSLEGDSGYMTVSIDGNGPVTPYFSNFSGTGKSLGGQARLAATGLAGARLSFIDSSVPATFVDPRESAGGQFASLHRYLSSADAAELARRLAEAANRPEPSWLDDFAYLLGDVASAILTPLIELGEAVSNAIGEWWDSLSPATRGILTAVGEAVAMIAGAMALAGIIVLLSPVELAFGAVMLGIGVVALIGSFVWALGSRISEAWNSDDRWNLLGVPFVALCDAVGIGGIVQAATNESMLTGQPLNMGEEQRWKTGTSGVIQLVGIFFMARGAMRGGAAPGELVSPEVRGNMTDFNALPPERLPVLPEGHSWVRQGGDWTIERAPGVPEVPLEISIYSDGQGRINYNILSGDRVLQSDAMTRPQNDLFPRGQENRLPPSLRGTGADNPFLEQGTGRLFEKGHGVDYAHRLEGPGVRSSNLDPANFTPQARYWNGILRNQLVRAISGRGGGYREVPIYDAVPARTANNTPIPREYIFVETTAAGEPVSAWRIPNDPTLTASGLGDLPAPIPNSQIPAVMIGPGGRMVPPGTMFGPIVIGGQRGPEDDTPHIIDVRVPEP
jgi:hypothetical protein